MRAAIYCRISLDASGEGLGVERQEQDCRDYVEQRGWDLVRVPYVDNDISAFSGRKRPAFEELLRQDDIDVVVVWKSDRLARRGKDLQRFLDTGMQLASVTEPEFTGSTGLLMLRILSGFAEHESGVKSERVARKMRQKAEAGDPHAGGQRCFGFSADGRQLVPEEAEALREATRRILAGERVTHILQDFHAREVGTKWTGSNLVRLLQSPRLAGLRQIDGKLVQGTFPAVLDLDTWKQLQAVLGQRRRSGRKQPKQYLLTGVLVCGHCGTGLVGSGGCYRCPPMTRGGCGRISVVARRVDDIVTQRVLDAIPGMRHVEGGAKNEVEVLLKALGQIEADVAQLAKDHYVEKAISRPAYLAANNELEHRAALLRQQIADQEAGQDLGSLQDVLDAWPHQSVSWRQAVVRSVLRSVTVEPAAGTHAPVEERLRLLWRDAS